MFKKMMKAAVIGACVFAMAGAANAADVEINLYGASAQYKFWNDAADDFLLDQGCTPATVRQASGKVGGVKHGLTEGTCGTETVLIRYTARASYDGINAMTGDDPNNNSCDPGGGDDDSYRLLGDESTVDWNYGVVSTTKCVEVNIGASDVEDSAFAQYSYGWTDGHFMGTSGTSEKILSSAIFYPSTCDAGTLPYYRPVVVPFSFFINDNFDGPDNMTRLMAAHLFGGAIKNWSELGHADQNVILCVRHAGSGTHATMDAVVLDDLTGAALPQFENQTYEPDTDVWPVTWFYESSSDLVVGVNDLTGAVGYADSDKIEGSSSYPNVVRMTYQGEWGESDEIKNGKYPFWAAQYLYVDAKTPGSWIDNLGNWAAIGSNMPSDRAPFWAAQGDMKVYKDNSFSFPER